MGGASEWKERRQAVRALRLVFARECALAEHRSVSHARRGGALGRRNIRRNRSQFLRRELTGYAEGALCTRQSASGAGRPGRRTAVGGASLAGRSGLTGG